MAGAGDSAARPIYRAARPGDASRISSLYHEEYRPEGGGDARDHYPFPQFLEPDWVATAVRREEICWIVAELLGRVVGSAGAMRNIGSALDRVAEVFGIVVDRGVRGRGIGNGLVDYLYEALGDEVDVTLCEARTGDARGWKVARHSGFDPIGFEPFAHVTPVGSESMLLTARVRAGAGRNTVAVLATEAARLLAEVVARSSRSARGPSRTGEPRAPLPGWPAVDGTCTAQVVRDDERGAAFLAEWHGRLRHRSGVLDLQRIEGIDPPGRARYDRRHYILQVGHDILACGRIVWDRTDGRVRLLNLQSRVEDAGDLLIQGIVDSLSPERGHDRPIIVIDIRADAPELQVSLEAMGFIPTAYYPAVIAGEREAMSGERVRIDGIQYTLLDRRPIELSLSSIERLDWEAARQVVTRVVGLAGKDRM
jgi:GNAT superfamily N-acetyltransferase